MKDQVDALDAEVSPPPSLTARSHHRRSATDWPARSAGAQDPLRSRPERFDSGARPRASPRWACRCLRWTRRTASARGHDSGRATGAVRDIHDKLGSPPTVALTATATPEVRRDIRARAEACGTRKLVLTGFDRPNLRWHVVRTKNDSEKDGTLVSLLGRHEGVAIVYAATRRRWIAWRSTVERGHLGRRVPRGDSTRRAGRRCRSRSCGAQP